jgi:anaerobic C4-dicarboxylate transporter
LLVDNKGYIADASPSAAYILFYPLDELMDMNQNDNNQKKRSLWLWIIIAAIVVIVGIGGYAYGKAQAKKLSVKNNANIAADREIQAVVAKVGALMELPKDEQPAMITIIDKSKLANEDFFVDAQTGDQVLVYGLARKVIIYRPETNKIIEATTFILPKTK